LNCIIDDISGLAGLLEIPTSAIQRVVVDIDRSSTSTTVVEFELVSGE
jgi:hypothetical protein